MRLKAIETRWWLTLLAALLVAACAMSIMAQTPKPATQTPAKQPTSPAQPAAPPTLQSATQRNEPPLFPKDMVIMKVGDHTYTVEDFNRIMEVFSPQQRAYYNGPGRRKFADDFSQLLILSDEAKRQNLQSDPIIKERLELMTDQSLAQSLLKRIEDNVKISDDEIQKYYNDHQAQFETIKASHILIRVKGSPAPLPPGRKDLTDVEAKAKADEVYKEAIAPGADFAALAKAESYDTVSAAKGGELGVFHRGQMIPAFENAAFSLKAGEISQPIKTPFGYHIIKVEDRQTQTLEEVKSQIEDTLRKEKTQAAVEALKKPVQIDLNSQFFPPPAPPAAPAAAPPTPPTPPAPAEKK